MGHPMHLRPGRGSAMLLLVGALVAGACGGGEDVASVAAPPAAPAPETTTTEAPPPDTTTVAPPPATDPPPPTTLAAPPATVAAPVAPPQPRVVATPGWGEPFATVAGLTLVHPATVVERVGFHESNHDGAQTMEAAPTAVAPVQLESRKRDTRPNGAADVVVEPTAEIRAPVSGVVKRAGGYVLYCKHRDDFVVIRPDAQPELEVKILHISGVQVAPGQRVEAAETVLAPRATQLPFASQVDETTASPAWPHVHIEVVDPRIKNRPKPGSGC